MIKEILKRAIPPPFLEFYHRSFARISAVYYRNPSRRLIVIGVTGTNGKSTTVNLIAELLRCLGFRVGSASTISFRIGETERLNNRKMTMLGRGELQRMLKEMVDNRCEYAIIETSSEGIRQFRHLGILYDVAVFTNLTPEHLLSHGGFENYKHAKLQLFYYIEKLPKKIINGKEAPRAAIANGNDEHARDFLSVSVPKKIAFGIEGKETYGTALTYTATNVSLKKDGSSFLLEGEQFQTPYIGECNVMNVLAALSTLSVLGFEFKKFAPCVKNLKPLPGRFEFINEGQPFSVMVDYAPEPASLKALYETLSLVPHKRLIHVLGSTGGGRDKARRRVLGGMAASKASLIVVTNEDPYDDNPESIIKDVAGGALAGGKTQGKDLFLILDRKEAIAFALSQARIGDFVLVTGKGSEQAMAVAHGKKLPWDDRAVIRDILRSKSLVDNLS